MTKEEFRRFRMECGLTQKRVAELMNTNEQRIARWERGVSRVNPIGAMFMEGVWREIYLGHAKVFT